MSRYRDSSFVLVLAAVLVCLAASSPSSQILEEIYLVESPTAGIVPHGGYLFMGGIGPSNSLLFGAKIGFYDRLLLGVSFGLQNFIGRGEVEVNDRPGFQIRFRIIEEGKYGPALALGLDTQGEGVYHEDDERYDRKSKGFYAVISRNYRFLTDISFHAGVNYSLEREDEESVNAFGGLAITLIPGFSIIGDYSASLDDDDSDNPSARTRGYGYLDVGLRFDYGENLRLKLNFKDLLDNYKPESGVARTFELFYVNYF
jgi:hypothetical protein